MGSEEQYKLLPGSPAGDAYDHPNGGQSDAFVATVRRQHTLRVVVAVESVLIVVLVTAVFMALGHISAPGTQSSHLHYSPADSAAKYVETVFTSNFHESNIYLHYPNDEVDKAWTDLYNEFGPSQISRSEAMLLPNKTLPIPADPEHYIVALSVFHQIHCLNVLRKAIYPEYYSDPETGALDDIPKDEITDHVNHCLDMVLQGIMCAGDITYALPNYPSNS
ncbi:hypothetical protein EIP86_010369 [Pleurotus ostreatoroseus]|nr:hypothetical protein EIP86_010369 [Pleurotus ostreatoroseus]